MLPGTGRGRVSAETTRRPDADSNAATWSGFWRTEGSCGPPVPRAGLDASWLTSKEPAAGPEARCRRGQRRPEALRRQLQVCHERQVEAAGLRVEEGRVLDPPLDAVIDPQRLGGALAPAQAHGREVHRRYPPSPLGEPHRMAPSPAPRSSARPGGIPLSSYATQTLGSALQTRASPA
jgi:hypothetical protein